MSEQINITDVSCMWYVIVIGDGIIVNGAVHSVERLAI